MFGRKVGRMDLHFMYVCVVCPAMWWLRLFSLNIYCKNFALVENRRADGRKEKKYVNIVDRSIVYLLGAHNNKWTGGTATAIFRSLFFFFARHICHSWDAPRWCFRIANKSTGNDWVDTVGSSLWHSISLAAHYKNIETEWIIWVWSENLDSRLSLDASTIENGQLSQANGNFSVALDFVFIFRIFEEFSMEMRYRRMSGGLHFTYIFNILVWFRVDIRSKWWNECAPAGLLAIWPAFIKSMKESFYLYNVCGPEYLCEARCEAFPCNDEIWR